MEYEDESSESTGQPESEARLLDLTNKLLDHVGILSKKVVSIDELIRVGSSLFVAIFESLFHVRVPGIIRTPKTTEDYAFNAQLVIDSLSQQIQMDLTHITGESIMLGNLQSISNLINILYRIVGLTQTASINTNEIGGDVIETFIAPSKSIGSISTHESDFDFEDDELNLLDDFSSNKKMNNSSLDLLNKSEKMFYLEDKLHKAAERRNRITCKRESVAMAANRLKRDRSRSLLQARKIEELSAIERTSRMRASNEEHVMLRRVYTGLLSKMHEWKREEVRESRERLSWLRSDMEKQLEGLEALFNDRVKMIKEQDLSINTKKDELVRAQRKMLSEVLASQKHQQAEIMRERLNALAQRRYHSEVVRSEAHKDLLMLLSVEDWPSLLRHDPAGNLQRKVMHASRPRNTGAANARKRMK